MFEKDKKPVTAEMREPTVEVREPLETAGTVQEPLETAGTAQEPLEIPKQKPLETPETPTVAYVLQQLEAIRQDNAYIHEALESLVAMRDGESSPGNDLDPAKAAAIADVVKCRETTNQKLIDFYKRVYRDCKPREKTGTLDVDGVYEILELLNNVRLSGVDDPEVYEALHEGLRMRVI